MKTIAFIVLIVLISSLVIAVFLRYRMQYLFPPSLPSFLLALFYRKLTDEEQNAVEQYIQTCKNYHQEMVLATNNNIIEDPLILPARYHLVYPATRAITRYSFSADAIRRWSYYIDDVEVHLPPHWGQYITDINNVELVRTQPVPLVISLNGHSLINEPYQKPAAALWQSVNKKASIRKEKSENLELFKVRKETPLESELCQTDNISEALTVSFAFFLLFISMISPALLTPWIAAISGIIMAAGVWFFWQPPPKKILRDVYCLRGILKHWGLFSEASQSQLSNVSLGSVDLIYPSHWNAYIAYDFCKTTDVEIYQNRQVVRQGNFLSLHDEMYHSPIKRWRKNLVMAICSLLILTLLVSWVPLKMPFKLSVAWLKNKNSYQITDVNQLNNISLHTGDKLHITGRGMCSVSKNCLKRKRGVFIPFDCTAIYWNNTPPPPLPQSGTIDRAIALQKSIMQKLNQQTTTYPGRRGPFRQPRMILLYDFADTVQKTDALCKQSPKCFKLKNALVNLVNAPNWKGLLRQADSGYFNGKNVLLRPVSAEILEKLVNKTTSDFVYNGTCHTAKKLSRLPHGGFLLISDENHIMVDKPAPPIPLFRYNAVNQWPELQHRAGILLDTPFTTSGIVTDIHTDASGVRQIYIHSEPDAVMLWRDLGICILLYVLILFMVINSLLVMRRIHHNRIRMLKIKRYYDHHIVKRNNNDW